MQEEQNDTTAEEAKTQFKGEGYKQDQYRMKHARTHGRLVHKSGTLDKGRKGRKRMLIKEIDMAETEPGS